MNTNVENHPHTFSSSSRQEVVEGSSSRPLVIHDIGGARVEGSGDDQKQKKKKRSKLIRLAGGTYQRLDSSSRSVNGYVRPKSSVKKPEPNAPTITPPCTECGRRFWSSKALFGHMRCHPERQWRGINPPPNFRKPGLVVDQGVQPAVENSEEDYRCANNLLMLKHSTPTHTQSNSGGSWEEVEDFVGEAAKGLESASRGVLDSIVPSSPNNRFECSCCKKVFPSHQALGGHRASHKNIKGCFALARTDDDQSMEMEQTYYLENVYGDVGREWKSIDLEHRCGICFRVFLSGQALGGHMRCHWDKDDDSSVLHGLNPFSNTTRDHGQALIPFSNTTRDHGQALIPFSNTTRDHGQALIPFSNTTRDGQGLIPFDNTTRDGHGLIPSASTSRDGGDLDLNFPPPSLSPETTQRDGNASSSSSSPFSSAPVGLDLRLGI